MVAMTLQVSFDRFAETVVRLLEQVDVYVAAHPFGSLVTAAAPGRGIVVAALTPGPPGVTTSTLRASGLEVFEGGWLTSEEVAAEPARQRDVYIAAVSYRSAEDKPGLWVDAYPSLPTQLSVLRSMYDEFRGTGQLDEIAFEEFAQLACTNVVIVSPEEIASYVKAKSEC